MSVKSGSVSGQEGAVRPISEIAHALDFVSAQSTAFAEKVIVAEAIEELESLRGRVSELERALDYVLRGGQDAQGLWEGCPGCGEFWWDNPDADPVHVACQFADAARALAGDGLEA